LGIDPPNNVKTVKVYLNTPREQELFDRIKGALGTSDTNTFLHTLRYYAEAHNLIAEALHVKAS